MFFFNPTSVPSIGGMSGLGIGVGLTSRFFMLTSPLTERFLD
jgi:hypothetical protein